MKKAIIVSFFLLALVFSGCSSSGNSEIDQGGDKEGVKYRLDSGEGGVFALLRIRKLVIAAVQLMMIA